MRHFSIVCRKFCPIPLDKYSVTFWFVGHLVAFFPAHKCSVVVRSGPCNGHPISLIVCLNGLIKVEDPFVSHFDLLANVLLQCFYKIFSSHNVCFLKCTSPSWRKKINKHKNNQKNDVDLICFASGFQASTFPSKAKMIIKSKHFSLIRLKGPHRVKLFFVLFCIFHDVTQGSSLRWYPQILASINWNV